MSFNADRARHGRKSHPLATIRALAPSVLWGVALLAVAVWAGTTSAQERPAAAQGTPDPAAAAPVRPTATPDATPPCCADKAAPGRAVKGNQANPTQLRDPEQPARWVCPEPEITVPPVWQGQTIECAFTIRNEGTGMLNIQAKGG